MVDAPVLHGRNLAALRGERLIFAGIGFALERGGLLKLTGRNGAGKSTLIRMIAGLVAPFTGSLLWNGAEVGLDREGFLADLIYAGHQDGLKTALTATENLDLFARLRGTSDRDAVAALESFGIAELADLPVRYMSAGQRRRVSLARLRMTPARLWLLDEPLTALDVGAITQLGRVVDAHRNAGGMVIAATHADLPGEAGDVLEIVPPADADMDDGMEDAW
ncbi:MAG: cytochrome c biogenesis heme-transporting ATPase CcmA [Minwuia sp.]|nr:cytochrome c biogenesis heme-transporting ATPase CcmA [Minwuia sp.]